MLGCSEPNHYRALALPKLPKARLVSSSWQRGDYRVPAALQQVFWFVRMQNYLESKYSTAPNSLMRHMDAV